MKVTTCAFRCVILENNNYSLTNSCDNKTHKTNIAMSSSSSNSTQHNMNKPTYCDFGVDRMVNWPGYFFCHPCEMHENEKLLGKPRAKRTMKRHKCAADHDNFDHPTTKVKKWSRDTITNENNSDSQN